MLFLSLITLFIGFGLITIFANIGVALGIFFMLFSFNLELEIKKLKNKGDE